MSKSRLFLILGMFTLFFIFIFFMGYNSERIALSWEIQGKIRKISYNGKGTPTVFIGGNKYGLEDFYIKEKDSIKVGDSLTKRKNSILLFHYKISTKNNNFYLYKKHKMGTLFIGVEPPVFYD